MDADRSETLSDDARWRLRVLLLFVLIATFLIRALWADQPIVENYVGRQVPTAMVARNLDRGSGLLHPQLDTAPFPNYFVVEPPIYEAGVVALKQMTGLGLSQAGRILSALATVLAALGIFDLTRRRGGLPAAFFAVIAFAVFPLTIRYGRAFQPDAAMMGAVVLGLACWDRYCWQPRGHWLALGWALLALGFALKITAAFLIVPLVVAIIPARTPRAVIMASSTILPAVVWYLWAFYLVGTDQGSRASADNGSIWLGLLGPIALLKTAALKQIGWFLFVRAFTPLGAGLAVIGLAAGVWNRGLRRSDPIAGTSYRHGDALWVIWGLAALVALALVAGKLHHEYYWLVVAPVAAAGVGGALARLTRSSSLLATVLTASLIMLSWLQVRSTWRTPEEWNDLERAARVVRATIPEESWVIAPEALLFASDRRGCRMEWEKRAASRAAGEWEADRSVEGPLELVDYYRSRGARYFADVGCRDTDLTRKGLHDVLRQRYKVIVDRSDVIIADLADSERHWNAN